MFARGRRARQHVNSRIRKGARWAPWALSAFSACLSCNGGKMPQLRTWALLLRGCTSAVR
eukprot:4700998-Pyramimonas_sp.AAC.1